MKTFNSDNVVLEVVVSNYIDVKIINNKNKYTMTWTDYNGIDDIGINSLKINIGNIEEDLDFLKSKSPFNIRVKDLKECNDDITIKYFTDDGVNTYTYDNVIPDSDYVFKNIIDYIFDMLPHKLYEYKYIANESYSLESNGYRHIEDFNLDKDDINVLFNTFIINKGKQDYHNGHIEYIENIKNKYYVIVDKHLISVEKKENELIVHCDCGYKYMCRHIYVALMAIKNKENKPFMRKKIDKEYLSIENDVIINSNEELEAIE